MSKQVQEPTLPKGVLEIRLLLIEQEIARFRERVAILPYHHEISWESVRKIFENIVSDAFDEKGEG
jgi:hypothetical protein